MQKYNLYHFIYYKLYKLAKKTEEQWSKNMQMPEWAAAISFSIIILLNLGFILICLYKFFSIDIDVTPISGIATVIMLYILNYYIFINKNKYLKIEQYFNTEKAENKKLKTVVFWVYLIFSFLIYLIFWI